MNQSVNAEKLESIKRSIRPSSAMSQPKTPSTKNRTRAQSASSHRTRHNQSQLVQKDKVLRGVDEEKLLVKMKLSTGNVNKESLGRYFAYHDLKKKLKGSAS